MTTGLFEPPGRDPFFVPIGGLLTDVYPGLAGFGVASSGGCTLRPPEGGTPNETFRTAL